jgi:threonine dehydrogenase-like Zn-dependent dehydrogenase
LTLYNVRRSNHETDLAVRLLRERPALFGDIISHRKPIEQIGAAFDMMEHYGDGASKVIVLPG